MPSSRPRITFDKNKVCNGCKTFSSRKKTNWKQRKKEFFFLLNKFKKINKNKKYDCILAFSGGKDSSAIALKLKFKFGLNPLLVTFNQLIPTKEGTQNIKNILKLGFDHIYVEPDKRVSRSLAKDFFIKYGNPKLHWHSGVGAAPIQVALEKKIPLVFYAENGEAEYGGRVLSKKHLIYKDSDEIYKNNLSGINPKSWINKKYNQKDIEPYIYPGKKILNKSGIKSVYFAYFFPWDGEKNLEYVNKFFKFKTAKSGRNPGAFAGINGVDDGIEDLYYYMQFIKFGFGRAFKDACRMIQRKQLSKLDAIKLIRKYDGEQSKNFPQAARYMFLNMKQLKKTIDKFRSSKYWKKTNNKWQLKYKL